MLQGQLKVKEKKSNFIGHKIWGNFRLENSAPVQCKALEKHPDGPIYSTNIFWVCLGDVQ